MEKDRTEINREIDGGSHGVKKSRKFSIFAFIMCLIVSFFTWVYVMNTQNSNYTKTFSIAIEVVNDDKLLEATGLEVFDTIEKQASVTIQGKKTDIQKYSDKDFRAYIDVSTIDEKGNATVSVSVETPTSAVSVNSVEPKTISVYADKRASKLIDITPYCDKGNGDGEEHKEIELEVTERQIEISGPESYIKKIDHAKVCIPHRDDYEQDANIPSSDIRIYDVEGKELSMLYMYANPSSVTVRVTSVKVSDE